MDRIPARGQACVESGIGPIASYLATGNVVLQSPATREDLVVSLCGILRDRFAIRKADAVLRTPAELTAALNRNPYREAAAERPSHLLIGFLSPGPSLVSPDVLASLEAIERCSLDGLHLYVDYAAGVGRSKLTNRIIERTLGVAVTMRNWTTVTHMLALSRQVAMGQRRAG